MRAGALRERVEVLRKVRSPDGMGGCTETEVLLLSVFARILVPSSRDEVVAMKDAELRTHEVLIRTPLEDKIPALGDVVRWRGVRLVVRATRSTDHFDGLFLDCVSEA